MAQMRLDRTSFACTAALVALAAVTPGCGGASPPAAKAAPTPAAATGGAPSTGSAPKTISVPADRQPSALAGRFRITCADNAGEIIEFTVNGDKAVGRVVDPGAASRFGFRAGEEVMRLTLDPAGAWSGQVSYRGVSGDQHWDGITLAATPQAASAMITNEACYRDMRRAE
jgi:hypothetical protein